MARGKGEGGLSRVPADRSQPLKYWQGSIELPAHNGVRRRKVIRSKDKREAIRRLDALREELKIRGDLPTDSMTIEHWVTFWLDNEVAKNARPKTLAGYRSVAKRWIIPIVGGVKLEKISTTHMRRLADTMGSAGMTATYQLNAHHVLSSALQFAVEEGRIGRNPAKAMRPPRKNIANLDVLDRDEAQHLLEIAYKDEEYGARWITALLTGARRGEVLGLEVERVGRSLDLSWQLQRLRWSHGCNNKCGRVRGTDCPERKLEIPADYECRHVDGGLYLTRPKSKAGWRIVPVVPPLDYVLERHMALNPKSEGLLFTKKGHPLDPDQDSKDWRKFLKDNGITKDVRLHDLRHTAVDLLYLAGNSEDRIVEIVGHSSRSMTRAYKSRGNDQMLRDAMTRYSALFTPLDGGRSEKRALGA